MPRRHSFGVSSGCLCDGFWCLFFFRLFFLLGFLLFRFLFRIVIFLILLILRANKATLSDFCYSWGPPRTPVRSLTSLATLPPSLISQPVQFSDFDEFCPPCNSLGKNKFFFAINFSNANKLGFSFCKIFATMFFSK